MRVTYLGHASALIELDGVRFLTDPAFEARLGPMRGVGLLRRLVAPVADSALEGLAAVLLSHLHLDHLDLVSLGRIPPDVVMIAPAGAGSWLRRQRRDTVVELGIGDRTSIGGIEIHAVPARHSGSRSPFGPRAEAVGYVLTGGQRVYFAGDTGLFEAMRDVGGVDVALLPIAGWGPTLPSRSHLDPIRAARAAALVRARVVVPIHWGTYRPVGLHGTLKGDLVQPPRRLVAVAAELAPNASIRPIDVGETLDLS